MIGIHHRGRWGRAPGAALGRCAQQAREPATSKPGVPPALLPLTAAIQTPFASRATTPFCPLALSAGFTSSCPTPGPSAGMWTPGAAGSSAGALRSLRRWWRRNVTCPARRCARPPSTRAWHPSAATPSAARWVCGWVGAGGAGTCKPARWHACKPAACQPACLLFACQPPACTSVFFPLLTVFVPHQRCHLACSAASGCGLLARRRARPLSTARALDARRRWRWGAAPGSPAGSRRRPWRAPSSSCLTCHWMLRLSQTCCRGRCAHRGSDALPRPAAACTLPAVALMPPLEVLHKPTADGRRSFRSAGWWRGLRLGGSICLGKGRILNGTRWGWRHCTVARARQGREAHDSTAARRGQRAGR